MLGAVPPVHFCLWPCCSPGQATVISYLLYLDSLRWSWRPWLHTHSAGWQGSPSSPDSRAMALGHKYAGRVQGMTRHQGSGSKERGLTY